jgi:uncharacterized protein (TIGR03067 family)
VRKLFAQTTILAVAALLTWVSSPAGVVGAPVPVGAAKADPAAEAKKLEGSYTVVDLIVDGKPVEKGDEVKAVTIKDGTITISAKREEKASFTVDPSKTPAHIDIIPPLAKNDRKVLGIYQTKETDKGFELTIAFVKDGDGKTERPKDFKGEGEGTAVLKLLRKKEK